MALLLKYTTVFLVAIVTSSWAATILTADVMTSSSSSSRSEVGEFQVYPDERCNMRVTLSHDAPLRHLLLTVDFHVTSHGGLKPLPRSYGFSNPEHAIDDITMTSSEGILQFELTYKENSTSRETTLHIEAETDDDVRVGDVMIVDVTAKCVDANSLETAVTSQLRGECVGPSVVMTSSKYLPSFNVQGGDVIGAYEVQLEMSDVATEKATNIEIKIVADDGILFGGNLVVTSSTGEQIDIFPTFEFGQWLNFGDLQIGTSFIVQFDCDVTHDVLLNSDVTIISSSRYESANGYVFNDDVTTVIPTKHVTLRRCETNADWLISAGKNFEVIACVIMPPGSLYYDIIAELVGDGDVTMDLLEGKVTSEQKLIFEDPRKAKFAIKGTASSRLKRSSQPTWSVGMVTNPGKQPSEVIIETRFRPRSDENRKARLTVEMTSLGRILERNVIVTTQELSVNKTVEITQTRTSEVGSSDQFRVSLVGVILTNQTLYNVSVQENTVGLSTTFLDPQSSQLTVNGADQSFSIQTISAPQNVTMSYDASLVNLGADVATRHDITTTLVYFVAVNIRRETTVSVCIEKVEETIQESNAGISILIIIICFVVGALIAFLLVLLSLLAPWSSPLIEPAQEPNSTSKSKRRRQTAYNSHVSSMEDVFAKDNRNEMLNGVEILELESLVDLRHAFVEERDYLENYVTSVVIAQAYGDKVTASQVLRKVKLQEQKTQSQQPNGNAQILAFGKPLVSEDLETKHKKELSDVTQRTADFDDKFQEEMTSLVRKRHADDVINATFVRSLRENILSLSDESRGIDLETLLDGGGEAPETGDVTLKVAHAQNRLLRGLLAMFAPRVGALEQRTRSRDRAVMKWMSGRDMAKSNWNEMLKHMMTSLGVAERDGLITQNSHHQLFDKTIQCGRAAQSRFERGLRVKGQERGQKSPPKPPSDDINNIDDVDVWVEKKLKEFGVFLDECEKQNAADEDYLLESQKQLLQAVTSQLRNDMDDVKQRFRDSLIDEESDATRLDDIIASYDEAVEDFQERNQELSRNASQPPVSRMRCVIDDVTTAVLAKVLASQPLVTKQQSRSKVEVENEILRGTLSLAIKQRTTNRLQEYQLHVTNAQSEVNDVTIAYDEAGVRSEMQKKFRIGREHQNVAATSSELRHQDVASLASVESAVANVLRHRATRIADNASLEKDRRSIENLMMTLLKCMMSSKRMTTDECKILLQEHKTKAEEIKEKFALDRKRREEMLKRKTARTLQLRNNKISQDSPREPASLKTCCDVSDDVIGASIARIEEERETLQELFAARHEVAVSQQGALLEQELRLVSGLVKVSNIPRADIKEALKFLFPDKTDEYLAKLNATFGATEKKLGKQQQQQAQDSSEHFLPLIKELVSNQHKQSNTELSAEDQVDSFRGSKYPEAQNRRLSPLAGAPMYPGVRPEPLGRTASPEAEVDRYDAGLFESRDPKPLKKRGKRKGALGALKARQHR